MAIKYENATERFLIRKVLRGDAQAYDELYFRYVNEIYRYIFFRTARNQEEAEDLTQIVFLRAWEAILIDQTERYNFRSLIYKIARNLTIDRWRTKKDEVSLDEIEPNQLTSHHLEPENRLVTNEKMDDLIKAIHRLDPLKQDVIICRIINQQTHAETAKILGLSESHVRVLQHRALKEIRNQSDEKD